MMHVAMCVSAFALFCMADVFGADVKQTCPTSEFCASSSEDADELTMLQTKLQIEQIKKLGVSSQEHRGESVSSFEGSRRSTGLHGVGFGSICCFEAVIDVWFYLFIPALLVWYLLYRRFKHMNLPKEFSSVKREQFANKCCSMLHSIMLWVSAIVIFAQYNSIGLMHGVFVVSLGWHILDIFLSYYYFLQHLVVILFYILYWKLPMQEDRPLHKFVAGMLLVEISSTLTWHLPYFAIHLMREKSYRMLGYMKLISWITLRLVWMPFILFQWIYNDPFFSNHCKLTYIYTFVGVGFLWITALYDLRKMQKKGWSNFYLFGS